MQLCPWQNEVKHMRRRSLANATAAATAAHRHEVVEGAGQHAADGHGDDGECQAQDAVEVAVVEGCDASADKKRGRSVGHERPTVGVHLDVSVACERRSAAALKLGPHSPWPGSLDAMPKVCGEIVRPPHRHVSLIRLPKTAGPKKDDQRGEEREETKVEGTA